jgi:hypothetical protein
MKISIQGQDYTAALDAVRPLSIERKLNEPSVCQMWLSLPTSGSLSIPVRSQPISVTGDNETIYFTGYIAVSPLPEYVGLGMEGPRYRLMIQALSDELLLDQLLMPPSAGVSGATAGAILSALVLHAGSTALSAQSLSLTAPVSYFSPSLGAKWSISAGQVASQSRAAYRALSGALSLTYVGSTIHPLNETDGTLTLVNLSFSGGAKRVLANDVTVCGEHEPVAYVTEYFLGDGVTSTFYLATEPFFPPSSKVTIINELFNEGQINAQLWVNSGAFGCFTVGAAGLAMNGGNGIDGDTTLTWIDQVEIGQTLLMEVAGVNLSPGSTGILAGLYVGIETAAQCLAGFQISSQTGTGTVSIQPIIEGNVTGSIYTVNSANQYTLRLRVHSQESERQTAIYRSFGDSGEISYGGQEILSSANFLLEIQEFTDGVGGVPLILYDGAVASVAGACKIVAASSINLIGTIRALRLTNLGTGWVVSTPPGGGPYTRRVGTVAEAAECHVERSSKVVFYTGYTPQLGELVAVNYRTIGRAVGRAVNAASQQALQLAGLPTVATWIGTVTNPAARSSADCRNAALAIEQAAASVSALWSGTYRGTSLSFTSDVWPGDELLLNAPSTDLNDQVVVRSVKLTYQSSYPDIVEYKIEFANDWADDLAIKTSIIVPADAWLPAPIAPTVLPNLTNLTVNGLAGTTVSISTNVTPPTGGGFEIRRRDFAFMPGEDPDLVARGAEPNFTLSRQSANDRFYIRMFDGSTPPNYSEFSTALFINLPLGS